MITYTLAGSGPLSNSLRTRTLALTCIISSGSMQQITHSSSVRLKNMQSYSFDVLFKLHLFPNLPVRRNPLRVQKRQTTSRITYVQFCQILYNKQEH